MVPYYPQVKVKFCSLKPSKTRPQISPLASLTPLLYTNPPPQPAKLVCSEPQTYIELPRSLPWGPPHCSVHSIAACSIRTNMQEEPEF